MLISLITIFSLIVGLIIQLSLVITLPINNNLTVTVGNEKQSNQQQLATVFDFESVNYKLSSSSQPNQSLITINSKWKSKMNNLNDSGFLSMINYDPISLIKLNHLSSLEPPVTITFSNDDNQTTESIVTINSVFSDDVNYTNVVDDDDDEDELFTDEIDDDEGNNQDDHLNVDDDDDYYLNDLITIDNASWIKQNDSNDQLIKRLPVNQQKHQTIKVLTIEKADDKVINDSVDYEDGDEHDDDGKLLIGLINQYNNLTKLPLERLESRSPKSLRDRASHQPGSNSQTGLNRSHRNGTSRFRDGCSTLRSSEYNRPRTIIIRMKNGATNHN